MSVVIPKKPIINLESMIHLKGTKLIIFSFLFMITLGTILLALPISSTDGEGLSLIDAFFVSTSASCVTGLTVVDAKNDLTLFGQIVLLMLIQIGGLGIMTVATLVMHNLGYRFTKKDFLVLQQSLNQETGEHFWAVIRHMIKYTFIVEGLFAIILAIHFYPEFGVNCIGYGIFHSVSAFCNAGFDLFGNYDSLTKRADDFFLLGCLGTLIVLGGIGFTVMYEVIHGRSWNRFSLHTKIVLTMTAALTLFGAALIYVMGSTNPQTLGNLDEGDRLAQALFMSISCRTAGFNTFDLAVSTQLTQLVMIILMFIGASPLSTGGGIKNTTFFVVLLSMWSVFRGRGKVVAFGRTIPQKMQQNAFAIFTVAIIWVVTAGVILSVMNGQQYELEKVLFETVSAFGTVGMGIGITSDWDDWGKLVLSLTMLVGRVGILTFMMAVINQEKSAEKHPTEHIMVG